MSPHSAHRWEDHRPRRTAGLFQNSILCQRLPQNPEAGSGVGSPAVTPSYERNKLLFGRGGAEPGLSQEQGRRFKVINAAGPRECPLGAAPVLQIRGWKVVREERGSSYPLEAQHLQNYEQHQDKRSPA